MLVLNRRFFGRKSYFGIKFTKISEKILAKIDSKTPKSQNIDVDMTKKFDTTFLSPRCPFPESYNPYILAQEKKYAKFTKKHKKINFWTFFWSTVYTRLVLYLSNNAENIKTI
jgi:hypothetical protein